MVLVDVDAYLEAYLEDNDLSSPSDERLERMFPDLLDTTLSAGRKNDSRRQTHRQTRKTSSRTSFDTTLSLPTIDELNYSDTEATERIIENVETPPTAFLNYADDWKPYPSIRNQAPESATNSFPPSKGLGVRFSPSIEMIHVELPVSYRQNMEEHTSSPINSESSTSDDVSFSSEEEAIPEIRYRDDTCSLDLYMDAPIGHKNHFHDFTTDTSETSHSRSIKTIPQKCNMFIYVLTVTLLICCVVSLSIAVTVVGNNMDSKSSTDPTINSSNTTTNLEPSENTNVPTIFHKNMATTPSPTTTPATVPPTVFPVPYLVPTTTPATVPPTMFLVPYLRPILFLNCGGPSVQVSSRTWESDRLYSEYIVNGSRMRGRNGIGQCQDFTFSKNDTFMDAVLVRDGAFESLFCTERWFPSGGGYEITVPTEGYYQVELYFMETFHSSARQRLFNISLEEKVIRTDYDIYSEAAGALQSTQVAKTVWVSDLSLSIYLSASIDHPSINALAVYQILEKN